MTIAALVQEKDTFAFRKFNSVEKTVMYAQDCFILGFEFTVLQSSSKQFLNEYRRYLEKKGLVYKDKLLISNYN